MEFILKSAGFVKKISAAKKKRKTRDEIHILNEMSLYMYEQIEYSTCYEIKSLNFTYVEGQLYSIHVIHKISSTL